MLDFNKIATPIYLLDENKLIKNLELLKSVKDQTNCKIILALKAFSMFSAFPIIREYLDGTTASSLNEARLGFEEFGKEVHITAPAYSEKDFSEMLKIADHLVFNSFNQWGKYKQQIFSNKRKIKCVIRINPQVSSSPKEIYNPAGRFSRLGVILEDFKEQDLTGISGLHFHALCQQGADALEKVLNAVEEKFGAYLTKMEWLNFGGGHYITQAGYDIKKLVSLIKYFQEKYNLEVYLEPGEAVVLNAGVLVGSVLDIVKNEKEIVILDTSASCHMPDVLEMPYRPEVLGSAEAGKLEFTYRLTGNTCLAGDIIGDYSFSKPLKIGDKIIFQDMMQYTMVKNTFFNGLNLPAIGIIRENQQIEVIKEFKYEDFKYKLS